MVTFILTDGAGTIRVEYKTDMMPDNNGSFTIMQILGLTDTLKHRGFDFREKVFDVTSFKTIAEKLHLKLTKDLGNGQSPVTVVDYTDESGFASY